MSSIFDTLIVIMPVTQPEDGINEVCEAFNDTSLNSRLIDASSLKNEQEEFVCPVCSKSYCSPPRILTCLHVFCEECLNKATEESTELCEGRKSVTCVICQQVTNMQNQGALSLPCDYVLMNMNEMKAVNSSSVICTSCKTKEKAVARCADCPHFLCSNCNSAHQYMRCFENHYVELLDEIKRSDKELPLHKPIYCTAHEKKIQFYCVTCQETICTNCTENEHAAPVHVYEKLNSYSMKTREKLEKLLSETKQKLDECNETNANLENALRELESEYDSAKDMINETFQSYKAILEKCRNEALEDLNSNHKRRELDVMDAIEKSEKNIEKIEYACSFTSRILDNGSDGELLSLKSTIISHLELLSDERTNLNTKGTNSLEFAADLSTFQSQAKKVLGYIKDSDAFTFSKKPSAENSINNGHEGSSELCLLDSVISNAPTTNNVNQLAISMMNGNTTIANTVSMQSSPVTSSPLSMPSSFDSDNFPVMTPQTPPLEGLTTLGEMNLTRLASLAASAACPTKTPPPPNNVSSTFPLDLLGPSELPSTLINNIQALAKLGGVQVTEPVNDMMTSFRTINGLTSSSIISSFDSTVDANSVLDLVNGSSGVMNGHGSAFDSVPSSFFSSHNNGIETNVVHPVAGNGVSGSAACHHNGYHSYLRNNSQRATALEIHFKFGQLGSSACQFGSPHGFCIAGDDSIIVADTNNHRIQVFNKDGEYRTQFGIAGKLEGQLWYPRKIEILPSGNFVICDRGNERSRLQLFSRDGIFIKKIRLKYVDIVAGMTVAEDGDIVIVDSVQPSLYKLDESGALSTWFDCKGVMTEPSDIAVKNSKFYICDFKGHCVVVFSQEGQFLNRIGNQGLTDYPNGIDVLSNGNILVGDSHGNKFHICIFLPDGTLVYEYECPYVKVSRCCGLKITSEGCIITVAKNNHHVLVLKSPF